jgi:hypothetical protein
MRRPVTAFLGVLLFLAVATRVAEAAGLRRCGCAPDCWCRRPGLDLFRWVIPVGHSSVDPDEKAARAGV